MKLTKENIYINLQGKSKEELTELYWLLKNNNEPLTREKLHDFTDYPSEYDCLALDMVSWNGYIKNNLLNNKTEVTIQQLKEILQPMETFKPIAMRCTKEQFEAIKPKLKHIKYEDIGDFRKYNYLISNYGCEKILITNIESENKGNFDREVYEQWNEEIFLKACGIETETLQQKEQRLLNELEEVRKEIEENSIKVGDKVFVIIDDLNLKVILNSNYEKIK